MIRDEVDFVQRIVTYFDYSGDSNEERYPELMAIDPLKLMRRVARSGRALALFVLRYSPTLLISSR